MRTPLSPVSRRRLLLKTTIYRRPGSSRVSTIEAIWNMSKGKGFWQRSQESGVRR